MVVVIIGVAVVLVEVVVVAAAAAAAFLRRHSVVRDIFAGATLLTSQLGPLEGVGCGIGDGGVVVVLPRTTAKPVVSLVSGKQWSSPCIGAGIGGWSKGEGRGTEAQERRAGRLIPCINMLISCLLVLFLYHWVYMIIEKSLIKVSSP